MYQFLDKINSPEDLKGMSYTELEQLGAEIRDYVIQVVSENGGHLASNLGVVELTLAIHRAFESPKDKIIWDVGHQAYIHKILTGRRDFFRTLRKFEGMSGFPKRNESNHDIFDTGHSSTSISAALGMAKARDINGEDYSVVAVIGDGSMTGGMAFEALNHAGDFPTNFIVVLNDNNMSISNNIGGMSNYLSKLRMNPVYFKMKSDLEYTLNKIPAIGEPIFHAAQKMKNWFKYLLVPGILFEELGFKYIGPIDGHNICNIENVLKRVQKYKNHPVLIHIVTTKGKGYKNAEIYPEKYHSVSPFFIEKEETKPVDTRRSYSQVFGAKLEELAAKDNRIVAITAAMPDGTGLSDFAEKYKNRFFDVGIAEQHAVTFSAGLAVNGLRPVFAVYSSFLQRAYDQVLHDVCIQNLPVVFAIDRAGIVGSDGETHQGVFDISFLRHMPNMTIMSPKDGRELEDMLEFALTLDGPVAIRYPRGYEATFDSTPLPVEFGKCEVLREGSSGLIIAEGKMVKTAHGICEKLDKDGISMSLINARFIKPLDKEKLTTFINQFERIYTIEDNTIKGGFGSSLLELCNDYGINKKIKILGIPDQFVRHGTPDELYRLMEIDVAGICKIIGEDMGVKASRVQ